jgi:hypothetical protein
MTDTDTTSTPTEETPSTETAPPEGEAGTPAEGEQPTDKKDDPSPMDELPEWARKEITQTRAEAANFRTRLRDAEAKLSAAKTPEEFETALNEVKAQNEELERSVAVERAARVHGLPDDLAEELKYLPLDKIEDRAKVLKKYVTAPAPGTLSGGLTPDDGDDGEMDPRKLARRTRR